VELSPFGEKWTEERCSPAGCTVAEGLSGPLKEVQRNQVASAFGRVVVWTTKHDVLRIRVAPIAGIATAPAFVAFDGNTPDDAPDEARAIKDVQLIARARFAVVLLSVATGTYAFRLDAEGQATPLKMD
jgi:hypothetical protein